MHNVNSKFKTFVRKFENSQKYFILDVYFDNAFNSIYFLPLYTVNKINEASLSLIHEHVAFASCSNRRKSLSITSSFYCQLKWLKSNLWHLQKYLKKYKTASFINVWYNNQYWITGEFDHNIFKICGCESNNK